MADNETPRIQVDGEKQVELQLGGRHLALAMVGLALFGLVLFLLGRWSERVARQETAAPAGEGIEEVRLAPGGAPDPAAPRELTFYETLGKKGSPAFHEATPAVTSRQEPPAVLPEAAPRRSESAARHTPAASTGPSSERFKVQVAATRDAAAARELSARLRKKGYDAKVETVNGGDGTPRYKVRVGEYADRAPAERTAARIRSEEKVGAWIVRVQG